jgi:hypothetical protein
MASPARCAAETFAGADAGGGRRARPGYTGEMKRAILLTVLAACGAKPAPPSPPSNVADPVDESAAPCTAESVAGDWVTESGSDFEDITLGADGSFISHLHARPFTTGNWALDGGALVLTGADNTVLRIEGVRCGAHLAGNTDEDDVDWRRAP